MRASCKRRGQNTICTEWVHPEVWIYTRAKQIKIVGFHCETGALPAFLRRCSQCTAPGPVLRASARRTSTWVARSTSVVYIVECDSAILHISQERCGVACSSRRTNGAHAFKPIVCNNKWICCETRSECDTFVGLHNECNYKDDVFIRRSSVIQL